MSLHLDVDGASLPQSWSSDRYLKAKQIGFWSVHRPGKSNALR